MSNPSNKKINSGNGIPEGISRVIGIPFSGLHTFKSFQYGAYRVYYAAMAGNWTAQSMQTIVRSLLIFRLTDSAMAIGITALANALPAILVSLLGGTIADRVSKKYILAASRLSQALIALAVAIALLYGVIGTENRNSWWLIVIAATLQGTANSFMSPANISIIPEIVGESNVLNAISLSSIGSNVFRLVSPVIAGWIIDSYNFALVYLVMAVMYFLAAVVTMFLPKTISAVSKKGSTFSNMKESLRYAKGEPIIIAIVGFALLHTLAGQPYNQMLPVVTETILKISATKLGVLTAVSGAGALVGGFILASLPNKKRGFLLIMSGILMGVPLIVFSFSKWWFLSIAMMPLIGMGPSLHAAMTSTLIQTYTQQDYRGRMQSLFTMSSGLSNLGVFFAGVLTSLIGVQWSLAGLASVLVVGSLLYFILIPKLRQLE